MNEKSEIGKIRENCSKIYSLVVDNQNTKLFYTTAQFDIKVYDLKKNYIVKTLKGHSDTIWVLKLTRDQKYLLSGGSDRSVMIWDVQNDFKLVKKIDYKANVHCLAIGALNRTLFVGGSKYRSIRKFNLKNVLKSSLNEFNKFLVAKKKSQEFSRKNKSTKIDTKNAQEVEKSKELMGNQYVRQILNNYDQWLETLRNKDKTKVRDILINSALLQEQYSKLIGKVEQMSKSEVLSKSAKENGSDEDINNFVNKSNFTLGNTTSSNNSIKNELVEMIKKHNLLLNEKKILANLMLQTKNQNEFLEIQFKQNKKKIIKLNEENKKLKLHVQEVLSENQKINKLIRIKVDKNKLLTLKIGRLTKNVNKLQHQLKLYKENFKMDIKKYQVKNMNLVKKLNALKEKYDNCSSIEENNQYQMKYIYLLELQNQKIKNDLLNSSKKNKNTDIKYYSVQIQHDQKIDLNQIFNNSVQKFKMKENNSELEKLNETSKFVFDSDKKRNTLKIEFDDQTDTSDSIELKKTTRFDISFKEKSLIKKN
jgi:hypothetical protein